MIVALVERNIYPVEFVSTLNDGFSSSRPRTLPIGGAPRTRSFQITKDSAANKRLNIIVPCWCAGLSNKGPEHIKRLHRERL